jgi:hypothetical protein
MRSELLVPLRVVTGTAKPERDTNLLTTSYVTTTGGNKARRR